MPGTPVIARRPPCRVEGGPGTVYWCHCGRSTTPRFPRDPIGEQSSRRCRSTWKRRNVWRSVAVSTRPPAAMGLTHGSIRLRTNYWGTVDMRLVRTSSRLGKNSGSTPCAGGTVPIGVDVNKASGCSKRPSGKANASEDRRRPLWGTLRIGTTRERHWRTFPKHPARTTGAHRTD
jgi:hypothetical protein